MSKKPATKAEKEHMSKIADMGCIICSVYYDAPDSPAEIHHITTGRGKGQRAKHTEVIPLCHVHHRTGNIGVALHAGVATWESNFDTQENLLGMVQND